MVSFSRILQVLISFREIAPYLTKLTYVRRMKNYNVKEAKEISFFDLFLGFFLLFFFQKFTQLSKYKK